MGGFSHKPYLLKPYTPRNSEVLGRLVWNSFVDICEVWLWLCQFTQMKVVIFRKKAKTAITAFPILKSDDNLLLLAATRSKQDFSAYYRGNQMEAGYKFHKNQLLLRWRQMKLREPPYFTVATKSGHIGNLGLLQNNRNWPLQISWPLPTSARCLTLSLNIHLWDERLIVIIKLCIPRADQHFKTKAFLKQNKVLLASKCNIYIYIYLVELLNSAQIIRCWLGYAFKKNDNVHPLWTTHDFWPFLAGEGNITQVKSRIRSQTRLSQCFFSSNLKLPKKTRLFSHGRKNRVSTSSLRPAEQNGGSLRTILLGVSLNGGTPKSAILIGISIINYPFWGTPIFGNTHYCILRVASPTFPSVPKAQSHNQKFSPKFLAFFA